MKEGSPDIPRVLDARWLQPARLTKATIGLSVVIFAALLFAFLHPDSMPHNQEAFGDMAAQLGLPLWAFVTLIVCVAYVPIPFAFWHLFRIVFRSAAEGGTISRFGMVRAVFTVPSRHSDLRVSRWMVLLIFGSYFAAMLTYAYLADERDLKRKAGESQGGQGSEPNAGTDR